MVVYHDSSSDAVAEAKAFIDTLGSESITINVVTTSNLTSAMNQIQSWQADLVFAAVAAPAGPAFTAAYRKAGIDTVLCGPGSLTEQSKQAASASGTFTSMNYGPGLINMANQTFTSEYLSSYQDQVPTTYAMTTYDAGAVLAAAIAKINGDLTPQALNTALGSQLAFDSPRGRWQFNQGRTPLQVWYLRQVRTDGTVLDNTVLADQAEALPDQEAHLTELPGPIIGPGSCGFCLASERQLVGDGFGFAPRVGSSGWQAFSAAATVGSDVFSEFGAADALTPCEVRQLRYAWNAVPPPPPKPLPPPNEGCTDLHAVSAADQVA